MVVALQIGGGAPEPSPARHPRPGPARGLGAAGHVLPDPALRRRRRRVPARRGVPAADVQGRGRGPVRLRGRARLPLGGCLVDRERAGVRAHGQRRVRAIADRSLVLSVHVAWPSTRRSAGHCWCRRSLAAIIAVACRWTIGIRPLAIWLGVTLAALLPVSLTGHSSSSGSHDLATTSLFLHVVGISVCGSVDSPLSAGWRCAAASGSQTPSPGTPRSRSGRSSWSPSRASRTRRCGSSDGTTSSGPPTDGWSSRRSSPWPSSPPSAGGSAGASSPRARASSPSRSPSCCS